MGSSLGLRGLSISFSVISIECSKDFEIVFFDGTPGHERFKELVERYYYQKTSRGPSDTNKSE